MPSNLSNESEVMLNVENLFLSYDLEFKRNHQLRDGFVDFWKNPLKKLLQKQTAYPVLEDINLKITKGQIVGIMGTNGSGKTSLSRCIAGMIQPQQGRIHINGIPRAIFATSSVIHPELSGRENAELLLALLYPHCSPKEKKLMLEESLTFSELGDFLDAPFHNYSRGMQARLFLSLVTARPADLLILDEVYDGADEFFQQKMKERIKNTMEKSGAVLLISHNPTILEQNANHFLILHQRKIAFSGTNFKKTHLIYQALQDEKKGNINSNLE